jgi:hypothetical protein
LVINIRRRMFMQHRVAYALYHGVWPKLFLDHENGDRADNRIVNLSEKTLRQNQQNRAKHRRGATLGATLCPKQNKWYVQISLYAKTKFTIGYADSEAAAHAVYMWVVDKVDELRGMFADGFTKKQVRAWIWANCGHKRNGPRKR